MTTGFVCASLTSFRRSLPVAEVPTSTHYLMLEVPLLFAAALNVWMGNEPLPTDTKVAVAARG
ncbi:MAG: hypothetical protein ACRES7_06040 [Gammaproteobacteria bacterium]